MKLTKYGHCCLLVEEEGTRLLTDPGSYSKVPEALTNIDAILITHEHADHLHLESLKKVLADNPSARVITNSGVGTILTKESIVHEIVEDGAETKVGEVAVHGIGKDHAVIYPGFPSVMNTGYFIAERLFYPGDAFTLPGRPVEVLALPVSAPWLKISEAIDYAKAVKPKKAFPVHDGIIAESALPIFYRTSQRFIEPAGIQWIVPEYGVTIEV